VGDGVFVAVAVGTMVTLGTDSGDETVCVEQAEIIVAKRKATTQSFTTSDFFIVSLRNIRLKKRDGFSCSYYPNLTGNLFALL
jgi:hypothetical protein